MTTQLLLSQQPIKQQTKTNNATTKSASDQANSTCSQRFVRVVASKHMRPPQKPTKQLNSHLKQSVFHVQPIRPKEDQGVEVR
jgi:hypothetical protein